MGILEKGKLVEHMMATADHLEEKGWARGFFGSCGRLSGSGSTGHCVSGASMCVNELLHSKGEGYVYRTDLATALGFDSVSEMQNWNDAQPDGSVVIELLRRKAISVANST